MELVSVVMCTYKENKRYVETALLSIVEQTYKNIEIIIVVDDPGNTEVVTFLRQQSLMDKRIKLMINEKNIGLAESLNKAISLCNGKYVARMDSDDISMLERIEQQYIYLKEHKNCDLVCTAVKRIDAYGNVISSSNFIPKNDEMLMKSLEFGSVIIHPSVMFRKAAIDKVGGYNNYFAAQDFDLWLRMKRNGSMFHLIPKVLLFYRVTDSNTTNERAMIQGVSARYILDMNRKRKDFDAHDYQNYLNRMIGSKRFCNQFQIYERVKKHKSLSAYLSLLYLLLANDVCRGKILKNFYYIVKMKRIDM